MYIEKIAISNFRIYGGENCIGIEPIPGKNVIIISGENGYGKTTFLTALVWCLYGSQMQDVDKYYKDRILAAGGYRKYLISSMNRKAVVDGQKEYSVSIVLKDVELPGITCNSMEISRSYNINNPNDSFTIKMDGKTSELVDDFGRQMFIQDFVLPKEIAKFFFFDAEKIVEIAEIQSIQDRRFLGQAYAEVLGIRRYELLRNALNDLRIRFRKDSANDFEKDQFRELGEEINRISTSIRRDEQKKEALITDRGGLRIQSDTCQEKIQREGRGFSPQEIRALQDEKTRVYEETKRLLDEFKQLFEYAPFAIAGGILVNLENQVRYEGAWKKSYSDYKMLGEKVKSIMEALENSNGEPLNMIDRVTRDYYLARVRELLQQHLLQPQQKKQSDEFRPLHDFTEEETNKLNVMLSNIRTTYRSRLQALSRSLKMNRVAYSDLSRRLALAESVESDELLRSYRLEKDRIDKEISSVDEATLVLSEHIGALENTLTSKRAIFEELAQKIKVNEKYRDMDELVNRLVYELDTFVMRMKSEKRDSLESRILSNLSILMHKRDFVHRVFVEIIGETLDIHLIDRNENEISKDDLSKGEQQLYATAILQALVEESGVDFPVLIDSPLQKFDDRHSRNVITAFYPSISGQVVIFPLLNKELGKDEYSLLIDRVCKTFVIENSNKDGSGFREIVPINLFGKDS